MAAKIGPQNYPRIEDENDKYRGFLDESLLSEHVHKIGTDELKRIISEAIEYADIKTSQDYFKIPRGLSATQRKRIYEKSGKELFTYFRRYCGDPAMTALQCNNKHFSIIAKEQFRNVTLQKMRMNSGWRYQHIAKNAALLSKRFLEVSDIGATEADFNATIGIRQSHKKLYIYVSVKNRTNTMGGQDWPKAITVLETMANSDRNRNGPYLCVFGIAMEKGNRLIKKSNKTKQPYSMNTEIWLSDFFWPFFSNYSFREIAQAVLDVLVVQNVNGKLDVKIPKEMVEAFGSLCFKNGLTDYKGIFGDPHKLVEFFCGKKRVNEHYC
jgi:hypothetical protein